MPEVSEDEDMERYRIVCALDTPANRKLVQEGFRPAAGFPPEPVSKALPRLTQDDVVVFMTEAEFAL